MVKIKSKKMKYSRFTMILALSLTLLYACKEDKMGPLNHDNSVPKPVRDVAVENIAGGALINYASPDDDNLLYVKAVYYLNGVKMEAKASYYKNSVRVEGFGDTDEKEITLYAVSRSEKESDPVVVKIKPLPAPIYDVYNTLGIEETFGGVLINFMNPAVVTGGINSNVVIGALIWDTSLNEWRQIDTHYSGLAKETYSIRGLEAKLTKFGFFLKDRYGNFTDTLVTELTPIYEIALDKKKWADLRSKKYPVPQVGVLPASGAPMIDAVDYSSSYKMVNLWDGDITKMYHTKQSVNQPVWNPIDLGVKARLSRYKIWQRQGSSWIFNHGNPHEWEIWGTNTPSDVNSWVLLDHQIMEKPSGLPIGQNSNDDIAISVEGQEYNFPLDIPPVRYIAWKHIDNWGAIEGKEGFIHMAELSIWGQLK